MQSSTAEAALLAQNDALQANQTYMQMAVERQKHWYKIFEILQSLQYTACSRVPDTALWELQDKPSCYTTMRK